MDLLPRVKQYIRRLELLEPNQSVVVGVSGGADSLCALDCLHRAGYRCVVAHLDHGLRENSAQQADQVAALAVTFGLLCERRRAELADAGGSVEEQARIARYRFLASVAHSHDIGTIAVGHTADDQAETVLMHLLRGAGPEGLRGMLPKAALGDWVGVSGGEGLALVRPLLEIGRRESWAHCATIGLRPIPDPSNQDRQFFRNRLRHELLPELAQYNPKIKQVLTRTAKVMAGEAALIDELVDRSWPEWVRAAGDSALALNTSSLQQAPLALQRAAVRRAVLQLRPELRDLGFDTVEQIVQGLHGANGIRRTIVGGLEVLPLPSELVIRAPDAPISFPELPQLTTGDPQPLPVPGELELAHGWRLTAEPLDETARRPRSRNEVHLDRTQAGDPLLLRPAAAGDRIQPLGMSGSMKLSDLFVNRKVPWPARARWPIVCAGSQVLWVVGLHVSRVAAVSESSRSALRLAAVRPG